jgi:TldD protein
MTAFAAVTPIRRAHAELCFVPSVPYRDSETAERLARQAVLAAPEPLNALVLRSLDAARSAGAHYADARLTRNVGHVYNWQTPAHRLAAETEVQGLGVRALVDGYWGFAAAATYDADSVVRLAQDAVAQAKLNATISQAGGTIGSASAPVVELVPAPTVTGAWATPVKIDPFTIPVEEKLDHIASWDTLAQQHKLFFPSPFASALIFARQECVLGTTEGTLVTQTTYQTGGGATLQGNNRQNALTKLGFAGRGWELVLDAEIPAQIEAIAAAPRESGGPKPAQVGRYTLVCDGATMAALLNATLGLATQLDRALGYEANAGGTSYLNDPLAMVGSLHVASPVVSMRANRSAPTQLATVKWDAEGVVPEDVSLIHHGILLDYQTAREQARWLAPYYQKAGKPLRSYGYAGAETALMTTLQMMPNLAMVPSPTTTRLEDMIASVADGLLITGGTVTTDFQGRTGTLYPGTMRAIKNGRAGDMIVNGAVQLDSVDLWKKIAVVGGASTVATVGHGDVGFIYGGAGSGTAKGEPAQSTPYTVQAPAALIQGQAVIDMTRMNR